MPWRFHRRPLTTIFCGLRSAEGEPVAEAPEEGSPQEAHKKCFIEMEIACMK